MPFSRKQNCCEKKRRDQRDEETKGTKGTKKTKRTKGNFCFSACPFRPLVPFYLISACLVHGLVHDLVHDLVHGHEAWVLEAWALEA